MKVAFVKLIRRGVMVIAVVLLLVSIALQVALARVTPKPPPIAAGLDLDQPGPGHGTRDGGLWLVWLSGPAEVRGADMWRLLSPSMRQIDAAMHDTFTHVIPSRFMRGAIEIAGRLFGGHLHEDIPEEVQREIVGQMHAYEDPFGDGGGKFPRFMAYLAIHDIAQTIEKSPLIACSGFAVTPADTTSGGTIVGRNFDFEAGRVFDEQKAVIVQAVPGKLRTVSIAWPGMNGIVTGLNEARVYISVNAARSDDEAPRGEPVSLMLRDVLESAHSAEEAVAMLQKAKVRVADLYLVADKNKAFVVEKTPRRFAVREAAPTITVTNHFLTPELRAEKRNLALEKKTTSLPRYARLDELVNQRNERFDIRAAQLVLRDRTSADGTPYPVGDRRAIDGYIATHGVLVDFGRDAMWVSEAPHLSGAWLGLDLKALFAGEVKEVERLPPDPDSLALGHDIGYRVPAQQ